LVNVDLGNLVALGRLEHQPRVVIDLLDDDLRKRDIGELELALVS